MSTFVNMAIKQLMYTNGLPFEVKNPKNNNNNEIQMSEINEKIKDKIVANYDDYNKMPNLTEFINNN